MVQSRREDKLACSPKESNVTNARAVAMYLACPLNLSAQLYCTAACSNAPTDSRNDAWLTESNELMTSAPSVEDA